MHHIIWLMRTWQIIGNRQQHSFSLQVLHHVLATFHLKLHNLSRFLHFGSGTNVHDYK